MTINLWQIIGIFGTVLFSGRWLYQMWKSKRAGVPVVTKGFWYISILGNLCILSYFIFGNRDAVGILSNLFPLFVALYNLSLLTGTNKQA